MDLTPDQHVAARACGCTLVPATDAQVQRLTMQRRIFRLDGRPFLATRDGAYFETHGTLLRLIGDHRPGRPVQGSGSVTAAEPVRAHAAPPDPEPVQPHATSPEPEPPTAPAGEAGPAEAPRDGDDAPPPTPLLRRTRRPRAAAASGAAPGAGEAAAQPAGTGGRTAEAGVAGDAGAPTPRVAGRRRAGQPEPPRWTVAGKLRRGRLK